jgi:asparagine synthase (glutamine-hydrolysing)
MCGIAGFLNSRRGDTAELTVIATRMATALERRGPDDAGSWVDAAAGLAFGHRRLAIIDLSSHGHQPMHSTCGRYVISFNGEIYNFLELRRELEELGQTFNGHSDTEVMLAAFSQWGVQAALPRLSGMFAASLWDRKDQVLHLVRDRLGEKPLYYGWIDGTFMFASELKALRAHPAFTGEINRQALALYLRYAYVPTPHSIYTHLYKLPPGCVLSLPVSETRAFDGFCPYPDGIDATGSLRPVRYWSAHDVVRRAIADPFDGTEQEAADQLDTLLRDSVKRQMIADVPLGALLSGGVDSSTVAALMQAQSSTPVRTFTIGFREPGFDEAVYARAVARHIGADHTELYVSPRDALDVVSRLPRLYDEPFADASQIPTYLLCSLIRRHVTVALSGDGGDELFGGYNRYLRGQEIWSAVGWLPSSVRRVGERLLRIPSPERWEQLAGLFPAIAKDYGTQGTFGDKFHKVADMLAMSNSEAVYHRLVTCWDTPTDVVRGSDEGYLPLLDSKNWLNAPDFGARMMFMDLISYLPDDILTKVDRASMGTSLEVRVPMLDHRVVEFAWRLPMSMKIRRTQTKRALRQVLYRYVPPELIDRQKMGFGVPLAEWLRGPLRDWAEDLLDEKRIAEEGFFIPGPIRERWAEHLSGRRNWHASLWCILMFQAWHREIQAS